MAQTFTATTNTDGWTIIATNSGSGTTYTLKGSGVSWNLGSNPTSALSLDSSISEFNRELLDGAVGYKSLSVNGKPGEIIAPGGQIDTLLASLAQMVKTTEAKIQSQQQVGAPASPPPTAIQSLLDQPPLTANTNITIAPIPLPDIKQSATKTTDPSKSSSPPLAITAYDKPIVVNAEPLVIDEISVTTGKPTGNKIVISPPTVTDTQGAPGAVKDYTVRAGDTLTAIAKANGTTVDALIKANPQIKDPNLIKTGQVIKVPTKEQSAAAAAAATPSTGPNAPSAQPPAMGLTAGIQSAAGAATAQDQANFAAAQDWRVRLSLAPGANYLYNAPSPGILQPLKQTNGVIFPYTPSITVNYAANYEGTSLIHTNYKIYQYQNSSVDQVQITCEFTAQDVNEANYVLAVIHFFRTMTKMFYGQDSEPKNGTPPPLCYLYGMGGYQFDALPLAISGFNYSLPQDVDYIKTTGASPAGSPQPSVLNGATNTGRLGSSLLPGGKGAPPSYGSTPKSSNQDATWIPTKIQLSVTCLPIMSRNQVSNNFSVKNYATGSLLQGSKQKGGGFW